MEDKEYRTQLKELVEKAKDMYQKNQYKNPEYGELAISVVRLIENSDFGRKEAESTLELRVNKSWYDEVMDGSFDGVTMQLLEMSNGYLGRFGSVSMEPYSRGLGTRSATVKFEPKNKKGE